MNDSEQFIFLGSKDDCKTAAGVIGSDSEPIHCETQDELIKLIESGAGPTFAFTTADSDAGAQLLSAYRFLKNITDGAVIVDAERKILWANDQVKELVTSEMAITGSSFYDLFGETEVLDSEECPFRCTQRSGKSTQRTLRIGEKQYLDVKVSPVSGSKETTTGLMVGLISDSSQQVIQRQKLGAIYQAGLELGDLSPEEITEMSVDERIELLKAKILHYTQDLLEFETVEIRLKDKDSGLLTPLLAVGMDQIAADRKLFAEAENNGVTGFVAATGKSYLCEDTTSDPMYLPGAPGARSSLTVPLVLQESILGTFNVESPRSGAFDENDLQFLELFSREVAVALNTLDLLVAEKATTASESTSLILREIADPIDVILNDSAWILEKYIGHEPSVAERLQRILKQTREIRQHVHRVCDTMIPKGPNIINSTREARPKLRGKRILVVDGDESVRRAAHELLGRYGCEVETAHNGEESFLMVRSVQYHCVIADIRLEDMTGFDCFKTLKEIHEHLPVVLMTGFGYDPTHSIVKARQMGLKAVLYKPFRLDQLLSVIEDAVSSAETA